MYSLIHNVQYIFLSEDTYDFPPGPLPLFSGSPKEIVNFSDRFSPEHSPIPTHVSVPSESLGDEVDQDNPTSIELSFSETSKGGPLLLEGGFTYTRHRVKGEVTQWHCVQRSYCKARLHTKGNNVIARKNTHSHENNSPIFYNSQAKAGMKRKDGKVRSQRIQS